MLLESVETGASGIAKIAAGGSPFLLRLSYFEALGGDASVLFRGSELEEVAAEALKVASEAFDCEKKALALLARAEQSPFHLREKLEKRGFSRRAASLALAFLVEEGLLSERRFAEAWLRGRVAKASSGPGELLAGLRARGIDDGTARAALASVLGPDERRKLLIAIRERERRGLQGGDAFEKDSDEVRGRLRERGFSGQEIRELEEES